MISTGHLSVPHIGMVNLPCRHTREAWREHTEYVKPYSVHPDKRTCVFLQGQVVPGKRAPVCALVCSKLLWMG